MLDKKANNARRKRNREAADWLIRNSDPQQPAAEKLLFNEWLAQDPENCRTYNAAECLMGEANAAIRSDPALSRVVVRPSRVARVVATSVIFFVCASTAFFMLDGPMRIQADVIAGAHEMPVIKLEDGSSVQLNASSAIAVEFGPHRRTVRLLRGQAFFEVAHAPERPFRVEAGATLVTALGTAFDVRYGETDTGVTVTENAVLMESTNGQRPSRRVHQGQQALYDYDKGVTDVRAVDGLVALAWKRGQIAIDDAPLSYVIEEMNRHFSGRILIAGRGLAARRVSGTITVADTEAALSFVTGSLGVKATRLGPVIVIRD